MSSYLFNRWTLASVCLVAGVYYYSQNNAITSPIRQHISLDQMQRSAVVIGATGATGRTLVNQLLNSNQWGKVTIIHRRLLDTSSMKLTQQQQSKLTQHVVDMEQLLSDENIELFRNHDVTFCTLGTTRDIAKTAENWRKVDVGMAKDSAIASKKANIKQFSLLTARGSNANVWSCDWKICHGLLYMKSKGEIENEIVNLEFGRTSIFRPGLLNRGPTDRMLENVFKNIVPSTPVQDVARAMIYDAESTDIDINNTEKPVFYEEKDIQYLATL